MDFGSIDSRRYFVGVGIFLALLLAVLGPEGSVDAGMPLRVLQWLLQVAVPLTLLVATHLVLSRFTAFDRLNPWVKLVASGVAGGLLFSPFALALDFLFGIDRWAEVDHARELLALWGDEISGVVPPVALTWVGINAPRVLRLDFSGRPRPVRVEPVPAAPPGPDTPGPRRDGLLKLLPADIGRDIVYLMSELHYLRVVTTGGRALVLYNLRDAVAEMPAESGLQPHRSYWVASRYVERLVNRDGRVFLAMTDGSRVPVSRRQLSSVKKALGR